MGKAYTLPLTDPLTKEVGLMMFKRVKVKKHGLINPISKENTKKGPSTGKENTSMQMDLCI